MATCSKSLNKDMVTENNSQYDGISSQYTYDTHGCLTFHIHLKNI